MASKKLPETAQGVKNNALHNKQLQKRETAGCPKKTIFREETLATDMNIAVPRAVKNSIQRY